jgi:hypothetical protein
MKLTDEIIDTAEEIASLGILPNNASPGEVVSEVSQQLHIYLAINSTSAKLAVAAFNRYASIVNQVNLIT